MKLPICLALLAPLTLVGCGGLGSSSPAIDDEGEVKSFATSTDTDTTTDSDTETGTSTDTETTTDTTTDSGTETNTSTDTETTTDTATDTTIDSGTETNTSTDTETTTDSAPEPVQDTPLTPIASITLDNIDPLTYVSFSAKSEKGPFAQGSVVTLQSLDSTGQSLEPIVETTIKNDIGQFDFSAKNDLLIEMVINGHYFDEISGEQSQSPLTLEAIFRSSSAIPNVHANVLTHITAARIKQQMSNSAASFEQIKQNSEQALIAALEPIFNSDTVPENFETLTVFIAQTEREKEYAYLLALSAGLIQNAKDLSVQNGSSQAIELEAQLTQLRNDFKDDGLLEQSELLITQLTAVAQSLDPAILNENLTQLSIDTTGEALAVPDIAIIVTIIVITTIILTEDPTDHSQATH